MQIKMRHSIKLNMAFALLTALFFTTSLSSCLQNGGASAGNDSENGIDQFYSSGNGNQDNLDRELEAAWEKKYKSGQVKVGTPKLTVHKPELIIKRTAYTLSYNVNTHCANYVAWHLTKNRLYGDAQRTKFEADDKIPAKHRIEWFDYYGTGYDRGHLCPAGDCRWSEGAMAETFLMTNICPQAHNLNEGVWNDLEQQCRKWAKEGKDLYIAAGPIFDNPNLKMIGKRKGKKIAVPDRFFKVVMIMDKQPKAIGFIYPNDDTNNEMKDYCVSVDKIESLTGIDFFPSVDDYVEEKMESVCDTKNWNFNYIPYDEYIKTKKENQKTRYNNNRYNNKYNKSRQYQRN